MAFGTKALVLTLSTGLLLSACQTDPVSLPDPEMADDKAISAFASAGIPITDPEGSVIAGASDPVGPLSLTEDDVARLIAVSNAGAGVSGDLLDDLFGEMMPGLNFMAVFEAYVKDSGTAGSAWLTENQDSLGLSFGDESIVPPVAMALFVAEALRPVPPEAFGPGLLAAGPLVDPGQANWAIPVPVVGPICDMAFGFVTIHLETIFNISASNAINWLPEWYTDAWKYAPGDLALALAKDHIIQLWAGHLPQLTAGLAMLWSLGMIASLMAGWTLSIQADPVSDRYAVGDEPGRPQTATATVSGGLEYPDSLKECLDELDVPQLDGTGVGVPVVWEVSGIPPHGVEVSSDTVIGEDGTARYIWETAHEESDEGTEIVSNVTISVGFDPTFHLEYLGPLSEAFGLILNSLPPMSPLLEYSTRFSIILGDLTANLLAGATVTVPVSYHRDTHCLVGFWLSLGYEAEDQITAGGIGTMTVTIEPDLTGTITYNPEAELLARVTGDNAPWIRMIFDGGNEFTLDEDGRPTSTSGHVSLTALVDLGGEWVQTTPTHQLPGGGTANFRFTCDGDTLRMGNEYAEWRLTKLGG
ncbi:MAG: hypothetical protein ACFCU2_13130 [Acidimicrobiia bacterium]